MHNETRTGAAPAGLPLVVQLGFAGSRNLLDPRNGRMPADEFADALETAFRRRLERLREELGLTEGDFICGVSQLADGADLVFTRALRTLGWPQRLFLPQNRTDFLNATGSDGTPDFDATARAAVTGLFDSSHIIQERVVSDSADRRERFQDANRELLRVSDLLVCLLSGPGAKKPGSTRELIDEARRLGRPVLELHLVLDAQGRPGLEDASEPRTVFVRPQLPHELAGVEHGTGPLTMRTYCDALKNFASRASRTRRNTFRAAALIIIGTHLCATACAVVALQAHDAVALPWLLSAELLLLITGFATHHRLHRSHAVRAWALARLVAELARSALALGEVPGYLQHLFVLPLPANLRSLLRTLNVLHLRETHQLRTPGWEERRQRYIANRLDHHRTGQIPYYRDRYAAAARWSRIGTVAFYAGSSLAILATTSELLLISGHEESAHHLLSAVLGTGAILLPVIAVGALSLIASFDLEARRETYQSILTFLKRQREQLDHAGSDRAFNTLALETETRLLGEIAGWYARRAFISVT